MPNNLSLHISVQARRALWLLAAFLLVSCAAPAPPRADFQSADSVPTSAIFIADPGASQEDFNSALAQFAGPYEGGFANLEDGLQMYRLGNALNESDGGLLLTKDDSVPFQLVNDALFALAMTDAPFACVKNGDQAYGVVRRSVLEESASDLFASGTGPDDCSHIAGGLAADDRCENCGCIDPMGGNCPVTGMKQWHILPTFATPTPTPVP